VPSGVHKGKRIIVTVSPELDTLLGEVASILGTRKATLLADWAQDLEPVLQSVKQATKRGQIDIEELEKAMGVALLRNFAELGKKVQR